MTGRSPALPPPGRTLDVLTLTDVLASRGGLEIVQADLCSELSRRGHRLGVAHRGGGDLVGSWTAFAGQVRQLPVVAVGRKPGRAVIGLARAAPAFRSLPADVVYVHYYEHLEMAWLAARAGVRPIVVHLHLRGPDRLGAYGRRLVRVVDRFVAVSAAVADGWVAAGVPPERTTVIHNGVDTEAFSPAGPDRFLELRAQFGVKPEAFVVVYAGRMVAHKGVGVLLAAMTRLRKAHPDSVLLLAGPGPAPAPLDGEVRHLGVLSRPAVVSLIQLADVVAVPTIEFDGCPLVVAEALGCGIPVVASSVGGIPELLTGALAPWLVPANQPDALADTLGSLHGWRARRPDLAETCRTRAVTAFSRQRMVDAVEGVLLEAVWGHK